MAEKALTAILKGNKGVAQSEYMDEKEAEAELDRGVGELNDPKGPQFIKLGKTAMVSRAEVVSVNLAEPPGFA